MIFDGLNFKQKLTVIAMDVLLLVELTICIGLGNMYSDDLTTVFLKTYIPSAILTIVGARFLIKKFATPVADVKI